LLAVISQSYKFAAAFNADLELRSALLEAGFMDTLPNLRQQQTRGLSCYLSTLFSLFSENPRERPEFYALAKDSLFHVCGAVIREYLSKGLSEDASSEDNRHAAALVPILLLVLDSYVELSEEHFAANLASFYDLFVELIASENVEIRRGLQRFFRRLAADVGIANGEKTTKMPAPQPAVASTRLSTAERSSSPFIMPAEPAVTGSPLSEPTTAAPVIVPEEEGEAEETKETETAAATEKEQAPVHEAMEQLQLNEEPSSVSPDNVTEPAPMSIDSDVQESVDGEVEGTEAASLSASTQNQGGKRKKKKGKKH